MITPQASTHSAEDLDTLTVSLHGLPMTSPIADILSDLFDDPATTIEEVAHVVTLDPAISMRLLRLINSAYFGLSETITDLAHAIRLMGFETVREAVAQPS